MTRRQHPQARRQQVLEEEDMIMMIMMMMMKPRRPGTELTARKSASGVHTSPTQTGASG
jgi:hypothetical protein